jgi:hypothetical protein
MRSGAARWHTACALLLSGMARRSRLAPLAIAFALVARAVAAPVNDRCITETHVTSLPFADVQPIVSAGLDPGEPEPSCGSDFAHSVWYALTPPLDGLYAFSTCGSDFDTIVELYGGLACEIITPITCGDDADLCGPGSRQTFLLLRRGPGPLQQVHAQVGSKGPAAGTLHFAMGLVPTATNDACTAPHEITHPVFREVLDISHTGADDADRGTLSFCGAVGDVHLGDAPHSVWYLYRAAATGPVTIDTHGTTTPIVVAVFEELSSGCAHLGARVGCQANRPVVFTATAGQTYRIYVVTPTPVAPDTLVFRLTGPDRPPVAVVTTPPPVAPGAPARLDASGSSDPDGDLLTFAWSQTAGPTVALSDPADPRPSFTAPLVTVDTPLGFEVAVSDGAMVSTARVTVTDSPGAADDDHDGVPLPRDLCPNTPPGEVVDANGCSCSDAGHPDCGAHGNPCAPGRCDPATAACILAPAPLGTPCADDGNLCTQDICDGVGTCAHPFVSCARACRSDVCDSASGRCVGEPLPAGSPCADDGDPCTDDVCDGTGTCTHPPSGSFMGAACHLDALAARVSAGQGLPPRAAAELGRLLTGARASVAIAEVEVSIDRAADARHRLARAVRTLTVFIRRVVRLEARRRIDSAAAGMLLDDAHETAVEIAQLRAGLASRGGRSTR